MDETENDETTSPLYLSREVELRAHALQMANDLHEPPERVVKRAEKYLGFLQGSASLEPARDEA